MTNVQEYPRSMRELTFQQRLSGVRPSVVVAARVRPLNERELQLCSGSQASDGAHSVQPISTSTVKMKGKQVMVFDVKSKQDHLFALDFAFDSSGQHPVTGNNRQSLTNLSNVGNTAVHAMKEKLQQQQPSTNVQGDTVSLPQASPSLPPQPVAATQEHIFQLCGVDVISQTLDGYNVSVFAYGQTGSGKSYTMFGTEQDPGLIPRVIKELFKQLDVRQKQKVWNWSATCCMIEIYNNEVKDLLGMDDSQRKTNRVRVRCEMPPSDQSAKVFDSSINPDGKKSPRVQVDQLSDSEKKAADVSNSIEAAEEIAKRAKPRKGRVTSDLVQRSDF